MALTFAGGPMPAKKYKVVLTEEERVTLLDLIANGKAAAKKLTHARILLQADQSARGDAWADDQISTAFHVSRRTSERVRQAFVEDSLEAALRRKPPARSRSKKIDGEKEAYLLALACSSPPEGRKDWTMQLLADTMVALHYVDRVSVSPFDRLKKKRT